MNEKTNKIKNLENKNDNLETEMNKLKEIYNQESVINKETRQNYDLIKNNYTDIKNQYDLLNIKYQTLSDENFNYKRDKLLYEKELKTKNQMIQNLLGNTSALKKKELQKKINDYKSNEIRNMDFLDKINYKSKNKFIGIKEKYNEEEEDEESLSEEYKNNKEENIKKGKEDNIEIKNTNKKEKEKEKINNKFEGLNDEELKKLRDKLLVERNDTTNLYNKIPLKVNKIGQIKRRDELEQKLAQINNDLMQIRLKLKGNI
jgi:M-phase phosphoprotein 9